jgi:hypothetical protein
LRMCTAERCRGHWYEQVGASPIKPTNRIPQREQRDELQELLKKYGADWEPWRNELKQFDGEGQDLIKADN